MNKASKITTAVLAVVLLVMVGASAANADCGNYAKKGQGTSVLPQSWVQQGKFSPASLLLVSNRDSDDDTIVGFWRTKFTIGGVVTDAGFSQWHSDGTEILNSSRPPATSSFCLGVWRRTGHSRYKLNHFAISWNASGNFVGITNIREEVALSNDGESYAGTLTIDQYDPAGNLVKHIEGEVSAVRITVDTKLADVL